jgi:sugar lactone lactonase YvrE
MLFAGSGPPLQTWYVNGTGLSSAAAVDPGTQSTLATLSTPGGGVTPAAYGAAFDGAGNLYVVDNANNRVVELVVHSSDLFGSLALKGPSAVALDGAGNLYISDAGNGRVLMVPNEQSGLALADYSLVGSSWGSPRGLAVDGSGNLYVADATNGTVSKIPPGATKIPVASSLTAPHGVAVNALGDVFVASNGGVFKYPVGGGSRSAVGGSYSFSGPRGIAVDASGTVYVADNGNNAVVMVAPGGNGAAMADFTVVAPNGVAVDGSGNVYVTDPPAAVVLELTALR